VYAVLEESGKSNIEFKDCQVVCVELPVSALKKYSNFEIDGVQAVEPSSLVSPGGFTVATALSTSLGYTYQTNDERPVGSYTLHCTAMAYFCT
jgi:hypothetical protein